MLSGRNYSKSSLHDSKKSLLIAMKDPNQILPKSEKSLEIAHKKAQIEIEKAIRDARQVDSESLTKDEFVQVMVNLKYIEQTSNEGSQERFSYTTNKAKDQGNDLAKQLWKNLNPSEQQRVDKARIFDLLLLLMFNVSHLSEP